jgi:hypothetical protein
MVHDSALSPSGVIPKGWFVVVITKLYQTLEILGINQISCR